MTRANRIACTILLVGAQDGCTPAFVAARPDDAGDDVPPVMVERDAATADSKDSEPAPDSGSDSEAPSDAGRDRETPPPSCDGDASGQTNCGVHEESCCLSLPVPGGTYVRIYENDGGGPYSVAAPATISNFRMDKYEVTVGRFRQYVSYLIGDAGAPPAGGAGKHLYLNGGRGLANSDSLVDRDAGAYEYGWDAVGWNQYVPVGPTAQQAWVTNLMGGTWTSTSGPNERLPITHLSWYAAYAFCIWDGGFLPSQAEWEYVAAGGNEEREYPWGVGAPGTSNQYAVYGCYYPSGSPDCAGARAAPVGVPVLGAARWGQLDVAGNASEWVLDLYDYSGTAFPSTCNDCAFVTGITFARFCGASWFSAPGELSPTYSSYELHRFETSNDRGARCARPP
jgi:formylglycine-generating enzyme required for sulfatase activity